MRLNLRQRTGLSRYVTIFITIVTVTVLFGNTVLANMTTDYYSSIRVKGLPEDVSWVLEVMSVDEYVISSDLEGDVSVKERIAHQFEEIYYSSWHARYLDEFPKADEVFSETASSLGVYRTGMNAFYKYDPNLKKQRSDDIHKLINVDFSKDSGCVMVIYLPDSDEILVSDTYKTFTRDSRLILDCSDRANGKISIELVYPEILQSRIFVFSVCAVYTAVVETLMALAFSVKDKKALLYIALINLVTNPIMNIIIATFPSDSPLAPFIRIFVAECIVVVAEGILYLLYRKHGIFKIKWVAFGYSLSANLVSFATGAVVWGIITKGLYKFFESL